MAEDCFHFEVYPNGGYKSGRERIVRVPEQERRFTHAAVTDDQQLEHVIEILVGAFFLPFSILCTSHLKVRKIL